MRAYEESVWTGQGSLRYCDIMAKPDFDRLAAALRENLKKRKEQARAHVAQPSHGSDEEGMLSCQPTTATNPERGSAKPDLIPP